MKVMIGFGGNGQVKFEVCDLVDFNEDLLKEWDEVYEDVWCSGSDLIVIGESEKYCLDRMIELDKEAFGKDYECEYVKLEGRKMLDWLMS